MGESSFTAGVRLQPDRGRGGGEVGEVVGESVQPAGGGYKSSVTCPEGWQ